MVALDGEVGNQILQDGLLRTRGEYAIAHKLLDEVLLNIFVWCVWVGVERFTGHARLAT